MLFWIVVAGLAAGVTWAIARPLTTPRSDVRDTAEADIAVYKDQLAEIAADRERGALPAPDAEIAHAEVARRLLRKSVSRAQIAATAGERWARAAHLVIVIALPLASLAGYLLLGAPGLPSQPLSERLAHQGNDISANDLVAKVEARLRAHPEDGKGWDVIAPAYAAMGRYQDAASAFASAMRLLGETPDRLLGFASARIRADNGLVADDTKAALERVRALAPERREPRIWLALAKEQDGKSAEAIADYRALISEAPEGAPWKPFVEDRLAVLGAGGKPAEPATPGATPGAIPAATPAEGSAGIDPAAVAAMPPEERQKLIDQMVSRLAERQKADGSDAEGWKKLIRAYQVLGRKDDALKALADARARLQTDKAGLDSVNAFARELGLGG